MRLSLFRRDFVWEPLRRNFLDGQLDELGIIFLLLEKHHPEQWEKIRHSWLFASSTWMMIRQEGFIAAGAPGFLSRVQSRISFKVALRKKELFISRQHNETLQIKTLIFFLPQRSKFLFWPSKNEEEFFGLLYFLSVFVWVCNKGATEVRKVHQCIAFIYGTVDYA